jgi:hypothetical protein
MSRRGIWPRAGDEGSSIEGCYLGPSSAGRARLPVLVLEGLAGQDWYVHLTRQLKPVARQLRPGEVCRFTFLRMRRIRSRDVRVVTVDRWVFHDAPKGAA